MTKSRFFLWIIFIFLFMVSIRLFAQDLTYTETSTYTTIDPITASNAVSIRIVELLFGALYTFDLDRNIIPEFADGMPEISSDRRSAIVKLKDNLKWSDGRPLTVTDVIFSFQALTNPKSEGRNGELLKKIIKDIKPISGKQLQVQFKKSVINPEKYLTFFIIPKHFLRTTSIKKSISYCRKPKVTSGQYKIKSKHDEAFTIQFQVNPNYSKQPSIKTIKQIYNSNKHSLPDAIFGGGTDIITSIPLIQYPELNKISFVKLEPYESNSFPVLILNFDNPLIREIAVRKALDYAIDRTSIINSNYSGQGDLMSGPFTQNNPYNNPDVLPTAFDPSKAKEFLEDAGFVQKADGYYERNNEKLELDFVVFDSNDPILTSIFSALAQSWENIGIKINTITYMENTFRDRLAKRKFDIAYYERKFDLGSEIFTLYSSEYGGFGQPNIGNYQNPQVDRLLDESIRTPDFAMKIEINKMLHKLLHDDVANIFLWQIKSYAAYHAKLKHVSIDPFFFFTTIGDWKIEENTDDIEW